MPVRVLEEAVTQGMGVSHGYRGTRTGMGKLAAGAAEVASGLACQGDWKTGCSACAINKDMVHDPRN